MLVRLFFAGLLISFLGTLPLGTLNVTAAKISASFGVGPAIWFSLGALLAEMCYVRLSLVAMDWVRRKKKWFRALQWATVLILLALAIGSFLAAGRPSRDGEWIIGLGFRGTALYCFLFGLALSALNPVQVPFWFGWSTVLFSKNILHPREDHYYTYIAGIGLGTFAGNAVFIWGGRVFIHSMIRRQDIIDGAIGTIFALTALIQVYKIFFGKDASAKL
jgi:threonine/homoserine/homoserine lactone efflux protein